MIDDPNAHEKPAQGMLDRWDSDKKASIRHQLAAAEALGASEKATKLSMTEEALRKRREREERREAAARAKALAEGADTNVIAMTAAVSDVVKEKEERPSAPSASPSVYPYVVEIPATSTSFAWYVPESRTFTSIASAKEAGVWDYPSNLHERGKCGVFRDLWERGNFMGGGIRFGGDYLVYPGKVLCRPTVFPLNHSVSR